jgi:GNAT superfamily N-acetyltransferase
MSREPHCLATGGIVNRETSTDLDIRPLCVENLPELLAFLGGAGFSDNPGWSGCLCQFYYEDHEAICWSDRSVEQNRDLACQRTETGVMQGQIAYDAGQIVGWCNGAPRENLLAIGLGPGSPGEPVASVSCFVIRPERRRSGVARALLEASCAAFAARGMKVVEGYPRKGAMSSAEHYRGPLELFLSSGFVIVEEMEGDTLRVRRELGRVIAPAAHRS